MLAYLHSCRDSDRELADTHGDFVEEASRIVQKDQQAIAQRQAAVEELKVREGAAYQAPQFAAIESAGNFFLQDEQYTPAQQSLLLGALLRRSAAEGALKDLCEASDEDLEVMVSQFGTKSGADAATHFNLATHATVPDIMGPTHASTQCHLEFLYPVYHQLLATEHVKPGFVPADVANSKHYLVVGGGPIGLVMAIEALLRGHRVTVVDSRKADRRDRYVGVWPKDIAKLTNFGLPECAWVVWTVLNANNDRAPVARRNTSRLFLNISVAVRILTWSVMKLGGTVLRGLFFDYDRSALCTTDAESRIICPITYDEVVFATGATGAIPAKVMSALDGKRVRPFDVAKAMLQQTPESNWPSFFKEEPIHVTRYLLNKKKSSKYLHSMRNIDDEDSELLSNVPSLFIQLPAECVFGNLPVEDQDLSEPVCLPPGWHITGLTRVTDRKMFKILIFGPLPGRLGASLATATDPVAIGQSLLASTGTTGSSDQDYCREQITRAHKKGLVYVINTDFQTMARPQNIEGLGEQCFDQSSIDFSGWKNASLTEDADGRSCFVIGDAFSTPWYKLAVGLFDGIAHVDSYWGARDAGAPLHDAVAASEYQLCRRQMHICLSLVTINTELAEQAVLERLVRDSTGRDGQRVRGWSDESVEAPSVAPAGGTTGTRGTPAGQGRVRSAGVELEQ